MRDKVESTAKAKINGITITITAATTERTKLFFCHFIYD
jgi:hypothetical protein